MAEKKNLTQRLNDVRSMISGVQKSKENTFEHYRYMDLNDISLKLKPARDKCGVVMWASAEEPFDAEALGMDGYVEGTNDDRGKRAFVYHSTLHLTIANCDDPTDCINVTFPIFGTNKNPEKAHGTALTYGYKYFFKNLFCINDGEDDADGMDEAPAPPKKAPKPKAEPLKAEPKAEQKAEPAGPALFDLYALGRKKGFNQAKVDKAIADKYGCKPEQITKAECDSLAAFLSAKPDVKEEKEETHA
ncbi:MAG: ERF family protein [Abditibacteriota bacterium]|nr:ERF family protein [Abditibacteriota bacterium]